jgi:hypothetical protein
MENMETQKNSIENLPPINSEEIDKLLSNGNIEDLTEQFDKVLKEVLKNPVANPNELMFVPIKAEDKLSLLDKEARETTAQAKKEVQKILAEPEEIPAVTMTDEEMQGMPVYKPIDQEKIKQLKISLQEVEANIKRAEIELTQAKRKKDRAKQAQLNNQLRNLAKRKKILQTRLQ